VTTEPVSGIGEATAPSPAEAELAVARMLEMSPDLRGCAVLDASGSALAASGDPQRWGEAGAALLAAADAAGEEPAEHAHVGTEDGEAFALRHGELAMVAVTERFTLASLVVFDMRTLLRDLAAGEVVDRRAPDPRTLEPLGEPGVEAAEPPDEETT
jgi:hypothetical protein